jgi:hypothetical protein
LFGFGERADDVQRVARAFGIAWLDIGAVVFVVNKIRGGGVPQLAEGPAVPGEGVSPATATAPSPNRPAS